MNAQHIDVAYIAKLAKIELSAEETEQFSADLNRILDYVAKLGEWDTHGIVRRDGVVHGLNALRIPFPRSSPCYTVPSRIGATN